MSSVLQSWVQNLTLMQQSVLLGSIRGPDGIQKYSAAKYLLRWYRRCVLISAFDNCVLNTPHDPRGGSFTGPSVHIDDIAICQLFDFKQNQAPCDDSSSFDWRPSMNAVIDNYFKEFDTYPGHFTKHFMMGAEILGYKHPDDIIRIWWHEFYLRLVKDMHLNPETQEELDHRLGDSRDQWMKNAEQSTIK